MVKLQRILVPSLLQSAMSPLSNVDRGVGGVLRKWVLPVLLASLLALVSVQVAAADDTTETLTTRFSAVGRYGLVAAGVGLRDSPSGDIVLNVPGQEVVAAYLYWAGHDDLEVLPPAVPPSGGGDNTVGLDRDSAGTPVMLSANLAHTYGPAYWLGTSWRFVYWQDVTSYVRTGLHTYTVSGFDPTMSTRDGAGLIVVYEDQALPLTKVEIKDGLDRGYRNWPEDLDPVDGNADGTGPRGESAVNCFGFEAASTSRQMDLIIMLSGLDSTGEFGDRPSSVWYRTGTGGTPVDMLNADVNWNRAPNVLLLDGIPTGPGDYPFASNDGDEWDTYANSVGIPGGRTWACFQIESSELPETAPGDPVLGLCPADECRAASVATIVTAGAVQLAAEGAIGDTVWCDSDFNGVYDSGEGVAGVTVTLYPDANCDGIPDGAAIATQETAGEGQYLFVGLPVGSVGDPVCYVVQVDVADMGDCNKPITPISYVVPLDTDDLDYLEADFGFQPAAEEPELVAPIPEAATVALLGSGLASLAGYATLRWRSRE